MELIEEEEARNHIIFEMVEISMELHFPVDKKKSVKDTVSVKDHSIEKSTVVVKATGTNKSTDTNKGKSNENESVVHKGVNVNDRKQVTSLP